MTYNVLMGTLNLLTHSLTYLPVCVVLEYGVVNESTTVGEAVQFPAAVDRLSGTPWQNVTDTVTLPVDALRQLQSQQPGLPGQERAQDFLLGETERPKQRAGAGVLGEGQQLNTVFQTTALSRLLYALPAWGPLVNVELDHKIDGFLKAFFPLRGYQ